MLHRLLARDDATFTTMRLWEILFAPSVSQRRFIQGIASLDSVFGNPICKLLRRVDKHTAANNALHDAQLLAPEEDQFVFVHIFSTLAIWHFSGILEEAGPYTYFDSAVSVREKQRIMHFYYEIIQRHLYADGLRCGPRRHYLSKNPSASPKIDALLEAFPDARFIYLVRNPLEMIPSMISCLHFTWQLLGTPPRPYMGRDYVLEMANHWYTYPLARLGRLPTDRYSIVRFEELTQAPDGVVRAIYDRFGLEISDAFEAILRDETLQSRAYKSNHAYDLNEMGLTRAQIVTQFNDIFERFGFDRGV